METVARLPDDTVVRLDPEYETRWAHHKYLKLQVAVVVAMYPFLGSFLDDAGVSFNVVDVPGLVQFVLASRLVYEQFSHVDEVVLRKFYTITRNSDLMNYSKYKMYTSGKRQFPEPSFAGMELWEFHLDYSAINELEMMLDCAVVEQVKVEAPVHDTVSLQCEVETVSCPVADVTGSLEAYKPDAQVCQDFCLLCEILSSGQYADKDLSSVPSRIHCKRRCYTTPSSIRVLKGPDIEYDNFLVFGSQFKANPCIGLATNSQRIGLRHARFHLYPKRLKRLRIFREQPSRGLGDDAVLV